VLSTMRVSLGIRPWYTCQTKLFTLYSKSLIGKLRHIKIALACFR